MNLGTHDSHLYKQISPGIRQGADRAFQIHAQHLHAVAQMKIGGLQGFGGGCLFLYGHLLFHFVHLFPQPLTLLLHFLYGNVLFSEPVEIFHGLVRVLLGFPENGVGLFVGVLQNLFFSGIQFFLAGLQILFQSGDLFFVTGDLFLLPLQGHPAFLQLGDHVLEGLRLLADLFSGFINDEIRQPQLSGNGEGVAFSRHTDQQPVGGPQGLHVKFAGGVFHPGSGQGVHLQLAVVGGGHGADSLFLQIVQDGDGQGRAFGGVRSGAQLVEQHQAVTVSFFNEGHHIGHVGGEGTQRLLDALLVADVRVYFGENRKF